MKLIIAGSRTFNDYERLEKVCNWFLIDSACSGIEYGNIIVVSGGAKGADELGKTYAKKHGFSIKQFPAEWDKYGKSAGAIRNAEMADFANHCICFWDGKSAGTKNMIEVAKEQGLKLHVERIK